MAKQKVTMTIDLETFLAFKRFCKANAMKVSSKVELMMREVVRNSAFSSSSLEPTRYAFSENSVVDFNGKFEKKLDNSGKSSGRNRGGGED